MEIACMHAHVHIARLGLVVTVAAAEGRDLAAEIERRLRESRKGKGKGWEGVWRGFEGVRKALGRAIAYASE